MITDVYALKYGQSTLPQSQILAGGDPNVHCPISFCIYLLKADERYILVDAGCDTMPGFDTAYFCSPVDVLLRMGLSPASITDVIITHAHHDHIDGLRHFQNATVYIQEQALVKGRHYVPAAARLQTFSHICTVADGIKAVCIGGHATGSSVVNFQYGHAAYTIVGDECYTPTCMAVGIPTGASCDPQKSQRFLREYAGRRLLYCHDPAILPNQNGFVRLP